MKRIAIILSLICFALFASPAEEPLRVVLDDNYPPYVFRGDEGVLQGILIDQWAEWEKVTGTSVILEGMDWQNALAEMAAGKADVIDTIFATPERRQYMLFTSPYADIAVPVFVHKSVSGISDLESLKGLRIAVKSGDACIAFLSAASITDLIQFQSYEEIITHARQMDFRVFCMDKPPALFLMSKAGIDSEFHPVISLYTGHFSRAVSKGGEKLLGRIQKGFDAITSDRYREIDRRWFGANANVTPNYRNIIIVGVFIMSLILLLVAFIQILRKQVARKTKELKLQVRRLQISEQKNTAFINALPDLFFIINRSGQYIDSSVSNPDLLKAPPGGIIGRNLSDIFEPVMVGKFIAAVTDVLAFGGIQQLDYELEVPVGRRKFECRIVALDEDNALYIARDVTDRIAHEAAVQKSMAEKDVLLKEIHHRVKNNLQVISSLVSLQADLFHDDADKKLMEETQHRIQSMAQLHEMLYRSDDLLSLNIKEYISGIVDELSIPYYDKSRKIKITTTVDNFHVSLDIAMPIGLIINELVSNCFKYAFPSAGEGTLDITLGIVNNQVTLSVRDNGIGLPEGFSLNGAGTLGFVLIRMLSAQLGGTVVILPGKGTGIQIVF